MKRRLALSWLGLAFLVGERHRWSVVEARSPQRILEGNLEQNKALVRRWIDEGFNKKRVAVVDELFAEDFVVNGQRVGRTGLRQSMMQRLAAFPDLEVAITEVVAEGHHVVIWYAARGTHRSTFEGIPPTGKRVTWVGTDLLRIEEATIAEARFLDDALGLLRQLGSPAAAGAVQR